MKDLDYSEVDYMVPQIKQKLASGKLCHQHPDPDVEVSCVIVHDIYYINIHRSYPPEVLIIIDEAEHRVSHNCDSDTICINELIDLYNGPGDWVE